MLRRLLTVIALTVLLVGITPPPHVAFAQNAPAPNCPKGLRKLDIGIAVSPPNVVHTTPYVAKALGYFQKRCVDANIVEFNGGTVGTIVAAIQQGTTIANLTDISIARGLKAKQIWQLAPRPPQAYVVPAEIKSAKDLKGKRLSAAGGGVGSFNWLMGREVLRTAKLNVEDADFIAGDTAGRLPGLVAGQVDGVVLHPEDTYLAMQQKPGSHVLVQLSSLLPDYAFNAYGASEDLIAKDPGLLRDVVAAMIEADRTIYHDKAKVVPIMMDATHKSKEAVEYAYDSLTKNCVWAVNAGFNETRTMWTYNHDLADGDLEGAPRKLGFNDIVDTQISKDAIALLGGPVTINGCKD
jgi:ABC-type nitrate/sulfonate/bicarbonate transport system substrate-binding protein